MWSDKMFWRSTASAGCCLPSGASPALLWKCWPRSLRGPSTRPWQPFLRSPPSRRSPFFQRARRTRPGTSCGRCSWRRSGGPLQTGCSATRSSRAASEARGPPFPSPACEASRHLSSPPRLPGPCPAPPPTLSSPLLPAVTGPQHRSNSLPCHPSPVSALSGLLHLSPSSSIRIPHREARLTAVRPPESSEASQCFAPGGDRGERT